MQEEVAKHTKKIYNAMKDPGHSFWEKVKEVAIEIGIIVFAVTLSIWLHSWSDHRHEQKETKEFLRGLKDDLAKDIQLLQENKDTIARVDFNFHFLTTLNENKAIDTAGDRLISGHLYFSLVSTHPNTGRYDGFKSSGKVGTIENDSLKQKILVYYQQTMPGLDDMETIVNSFQTRIMDAQVDQIDKLSPREFVKTFKLRALLQFGSQNIEGLIRNYEEAQRQAKEIILMVDQQ